MKQIEKQVLIPLFRSFILIKLFLCFLQGFTSVLIPLFRSFILINRPGFEVVSAKKRLNPFVQVFYSNSILEWNKILDRMKVLIPLFRSFILMVIVKFGCSAFSIRS